MIHKIGQSSVLIDLLTRPTVGSSDSSWAAAKNANLANIAVFLLNKSEEGRHIRPPKVVARFQTGEQTPF